MATQTAEVTLHSTITCPDCGHEAEEVMPTDACRWLHPCAGCNAVLRSLPDDCCVFCSCGTVPCPPIQAGDQCCAGSANPA